MSYLRKSKKDHHRRLAKGEKKLFPTPVDAVLESETKATTNMSTKTDFERPKSTKKPFYTAKQRQRRILVQILITAGLFAMGGYFAAKAYPQNGVVSLVFFAVVYGLLAPTTIAHFYKMLSSDRYVLNVIFSEFMFLFGLGIGTFAAIYLPMLLVIFIDERSGEWLRYVLIAMLITVPLIYLVTIIYKTVRKEEFTLSSLRRKNRVITQDNDIDYSEKFEQAQQNYEKRIERKLSKEDFEN